MSASDTGGISLFGTPDTYLANIPSSPDTQDALPDFSTPPYNPTFPTLVSATPLQAGEALPASSTLGDNMDEFFSGLGSLFSTTGTAVASVWKAVNAPAPLQVIPPGSTALTPSGQLITSPGALSASLGGSSGLILIVLAFLALILFSRKS